MVLDVTLKDFTTRAPDTEYSHLFFLSCAYGFVVDGNQAQKDQRLAIKGSSEPVTTSPSLASMLLNQPSTNNSSSTPTSSTIPNKAKNQKTEQDDEDHISKLDIRVGIVRSVAQHPDADSLYIEQGKNVSVSVSPI